MEMGLKVTTLTLAIPLHKGTGPALGDRDDSKIQDLVDSGFHLYHAQLLGGEVIGVAWSQIRPHLSPLRSEWLNPAVQKCPQKVHPSQPIPS
jgi:hypothetical protein